MFHILYDGTVVDEDRYSVIGGDAEAIGDRLEAAYQPGLDLAGRPPGRRRGAGRPGPHARAGELEVRAAGTAGGLRCIEDDELAARR